MTDGRDELRALALAAADAGASVLLGHQRARREAETLRVDTKTSATDPVSEADRAAERAVLDTITRARPLDAVLAEEGQGDRAGSSGLRWVVDPLDGTVNFLMRMPQWAVSVAVEDEDGPLVGVVVHPELGERHVAVRDRGAAVERADGTAAQLHVSSRAELGRTLLSTGYAYDPHVRAAQGRAAATWLGHVRDLRRAGAAALDLAWVAAGRLDAYAETGLQPWDWAAGRLLVTEAGGRVSEFDVELAGAARRTLVASAPAVHDALVDLVASGA